MSDVHAEVARMGGKFDGLETKVAETAEKVDQVKDGMADLATAIREELHAFSLALERNSNLMESHQKTFGREFSQAMSRIDKLEQRADAGDILIAEQRGANRARTGMMALIGGAAGVVTTGAIALVKALTGTGS